MDKKRGRPTFKPTRQMRENVEMFLACGMTNEQISVAIGVSHVTFAKAFAGEIGFGRARARARIVKMLHKAAQSGNVTAQKKLEELTRLNGAQADLEAPRRAVPAGKKEIAQQAAQEAGIGTDWGDDLTPTGLVN